MSKNLIQNLYESAKSDNAVDPITGVPKFDEAKLRRKLEQNKKLGARNKKIFQDNERRFKTCPRYNPCPLCDKCMNKASHLYDSCRECKIPICSHTYKDREMMIKRENFTIFVSEDIMNNIRKLADQVIGQL